MEIPALTVEISSADGTVLVVEDEETLRLAVSKMLRMKGFSVIEAIDGSAAVDLFRNHEREIAVVVLDMTLPRIDGPRVFAELRRIKPGVKIIVTTAYSHESTLATFGGQQPWGFIRKPYRINELLDLLRIACSASGGMSDYAAR